MSAWIDHTGATSVATRHQVDQFNRDGYFLLERAFHPDTVESVRSAVAVEAGVAGLTSPGFLSEESPGEVLRRFCSHPLLAGLARDFVGPDASVHTDTPLVLEHSSADHGTFTRDTPGPSREEVPRITCWIALTDCTLLTGCLQIARGGHRSPHPVEDPPVVVDVEAAAGSVVVMSSLTPRRLRPNDTPLPGLAYAIQYARDTVVDLAEPAGPSRRQVPVVRGGHLVGPA